MYHYASQRKAPAAASETFDGFTHIGGWSIVLGTAAAATVTFAVDGTTIFHETQADENGIAEQYLSSPIIVPKAGIGNNNRRITVAVDDTITTISLVGIAGGGSVTVAPSGYPG